MLAVPLVGLGVAHYLTHRHQDQDSQTQQQQQRQERQQYIQHELHKRRERVDLLTGKELDCTEDEVVQLLQALEDLPGEWDYKLRGYTKAAQSISLLLLQRGGADQEEIRGVLDGPVRTLQSQLEFAPSDFTKSVNSHLTAQLALANAQVQERRLVQLKKARVVLQRALPELPMILISTLLSVYSGTLDATRFYLRGEVISKAITSTGQLGKLVKRLLWLEVLCVLVSVLKERAQTIGKRKFVQNLKTDLFAALVSQDLAYFERADMFELRQLIGNSDTVCTSLLSAPTNHLESLARIGSSLMLLSRQSPKLLGVLFALALPTKHLLTNWLELVSTRFELSAHQLLLFQPGSVQEIWQVLVDPKALKTMRAFAREPAEIAEFSRAIRAKDERDERSAMAYQLLSPTRDALDKLLDVFGVWYGSRLVGVRAMRATDLPAFVSLCSVTFDQARFLWSSLGTFGDEVLDPIERMHDLLQHEPRIGLNRPPYDPNLSLDFSLEFRNVRFAYPTKPQAEILRGVSFRVAPGERVGIMGESGCGKSTLFSLVERFYDPTSGQVLLGGTDLREINPLFLRQHVAFVSQQAFMAKRTIRDNLVYGRGDVPATEAELASALQLAQCLFFLHDKDRFPDGLLTNIGANASKLSGGEVQRLSLARALLAVPPPRLLLLDEYTSALDETSQASIVDAVQRLWEERGITLVCIAHRLSNFKHVDRIVVLNKLGMVAEQGHPKHLLRDHPNGAFASFVRTSQVSFGGGDGHDDDDKA